MIDEKFSELVNLYLDKEISDADLELLKIELSKDTLRREDFQERCRLHQAMRLALNPEEAKRTVDASNCPHEAHGSYSRFSDISESAEKSRFNFSYWLLGSGIAACLALLGIMLAPVFTDATNLASLSLQIGDPNQSEVDHAMTDVARSDIKRFERTRQQPADPRTASLAAELRLLGLRPEMMPEEQQLREVSLASLQPRDQTRRKIELFNELKDFSPIPQPQLLRTYESHASRSASVPSWSSGFRTSLASFK
jgi:hypothetical protein